MEIVRPEFLVWLFFHAQEEVGNRLTCPSDSMGVKGVDCLQYIFSLLWKRYAVVVFASVG